MKEEFVPYELALKLKQLGFDGKCIYYFKKDNNNDFVLFQMDLGDCYINKDFDKVLVWDEYLENPQCTAPLFQQAFRWFREKHGMVFNLVGSGPYYPSIAFILIDGNSDIELGEYDNYEEAELSCLDKLIEIVETKQQEQ